MVELLMIVAQERVDALGDLLLEAHGALAVGVEDADAETEAEDALYGEPGMPAPRSGWRRSLVKAMFADEPKATAAAARLLAGADGAPSGAVHLQAMHELPDQDWVRATQAQFGPVEITPDFWIVPSWHEAPAAARRVIRLDPGLAFGTGTHPTTRMCLRWIARQPLARTAAWKRVLDYGCGSGVLAIAAALAGARTVDAVDIDPAAVAATRANADANRVAGLEAGPPELASGRYPLVLANILAVPLTLLAPLLAERVDAGGDLVLAGLLERQADALRATYAPWLDLERADSDEGWVLLAGRRSGAAAR